MDNILQFTDEATAQAALTQLYDTDGGWHTDTCIPNISVYKVTGTAIDADGNTVDVRENAPGWFIRVTTETGIAVFDQTGWVCEPVFAQ